VGRVCAPARRGHTAAFAPLHCRILFWGAAQTRYWWARALAERAKPGDAERARTLVADSLAATRRMGMRSLEREAAALETTLGGS